MRGVVTAAEMKALDANTIEKAGIPSLVLMERAALQTVTEIIKRVNTKDKEKILVVCGTGNNGGDGLAIARLLHLHGFKTWYYIVGNEEKMTKETSSQLRTAEYYHTPRVHNLILDEYTTIVDAIFGVGLSRPIEGKYGELISELNQASAFKVAVDIPSGIDADTGFEKGIAFRANLTVTFAFRKRGLCFYPGRMYGGEIIVADIGIYDRDRDGSELASKAAWYIEKSDVKTLPARKPWGNKGTFGKVLLVAGSKGMCGAACLSASAALHGGAGMVKIQTVEENRIPLQSLLPEAMLTSEFDEEANRKNLNWCDVLVIGPGLGTEGSGKERMLWFLENGAKAGKPVILDADGLNILAMHPQWMKLIGEQTILTPHMGEMSRLCGLDVSELKEDPVARAYQYAEKSGGVLVLKDACTVVTDRNEKLYLNLSGNSGMATAGSGDVLSGIIAAVLCMYLSCEEEQELSYKAALAVYIHGLCGDIAREKKGSHGMTAKDMIEALPEVLKLAEVQSKG